MFQPCAGLIRTQRQTEPVSRGRADQRSAPDLHRFDRVRSVFQRRQCNDGELVGKLRLIDDIDGPAIFIDPNRTIRLAVDLHSPLLPSSTDTPAKRRAGDGGTRLHFRQSSPGKGRRKGGSGVEDVTDHAGKLVLGERLLKHGKPLRRQAVLVEFLGRIAGHMQNLYVGVARRYGVG